MRIIIAALFVVTVAFPAQTRADALECVDPDIVTAFLTTWHSPTRRISREMPEAFAALSAPEGFYFIGSAVADLGTSVAYRTDMNPSDAQSAVVASLETLGWRQLPQRESRTAGRGFQTMGPVPQYVSLCRDDNYPMYLSARDEAAGTYVILSTNNQQTRCSVSESLHRRMGSDFLPRLELPPDVRLTGNSGSGGSDDRATTRVQFTSEMDSLALMSFFNKQLEAQGWTYDGQWENPAIVGSIWSAIRDKTLQLSGTLQIVPEKNSQFTVAFSVWIFE